YTSSAGAHDGDLADAASFSSSPSVFLVGMRGSGKSTLGRSLAAHLRRPFLDLDAVFESQLPGGETIKEYVSRCGWEPFRAGELAVLQSMVRDHSYGCVISCGGGVVETPAAVELLQ